MPACRLLLALAVASAAASGGLASCDPGTAPIVAVSLNAVPDALDDLLIVPPSGFVVNVSWSANGAPVAPGTLRVMLLPASGAPAIDVTAIFFVGASGAVGVLPPGLALAAPGTYTAVAEVRSTDGDLGGDYLSFAVRQFAGGPPIGTGQAIWFDFGVDRDADGQADFADDLAVVGLASDANPYLAALVALEVIGALLDRVAQAYHDLDPNGLGADPVEVSFHAGAPGSGDVTRICVGGVAPGNPNLVGSILLDPGNQNRTSVECGNLPPTGIFPRGILAWQNNGHFHATFDPLMTSRGGTPIGEDPLDVVVLSPNFDPGSATPSELARWTAIQTAITNYANCIGSVMAHETGHALGLVPPGPPGGGLYGGSLGAALAHDVEPDGSTPAPNYLMKAGTASGFPHLAGLGGHPLPFFRALDFAYLRDRAVLDASVTQLLPPPIATSATPALITQSVTLRLYGANFAATPQLRLLSPALDYSLGNEQWVSATEVTGWINRSQIVAGSYTLEVRNPDGQLTLLATPIVVQ